MFELILAVNNVLIQESYKRSFAEKLWFPFETVDLQFKKYVQWAGKIFVQQQRKHEENSATQYQLDREKLFISLFYNWFLNTQLKEESEFISDLHNFVNQVARADPDWLISHTLSNTCSDEEKSTLDEFQLRWEKEISDLSDEKAKRQVIITTITPVIQELFKVATKSRNLSDDEKKQLIILKWKLGRR
jgi:hypothetical protein